MDENKLLNTTLDILNDQGAEEAYKYISENQNDVIVSNKSQIYNFLYCLAAVAGKKEEALSWLEEAILGNPYWYRPEVFEDSDLDTLREENRFDACRSVSLQRFLAAQETAKTQCTWTEKTSDRILLALHGNQQDTEMSRVHWEFMRRQDCQVEYLQSSELDSYQLYRWEENGTGVAQLARTCEEIGWKEYDTKILGGFSAGCNVLLKALLTDSVDCDYMLLQSPWIPVIHEELDKILFTAKQKKVKLLMICGNDDVDCAPLAHMLETNAMETGVDFKAVWVEGLSHDFPENFNDIIGEYFDRKI